MPYISGLVSGILLTILVVFLIDHVGDAPGSHDIVNWGFLGEQVSASFEKAGEEVRQEVHEATAPDGKPASPPPAETAPAPNPQ